jgi:hypothetical protein
MYHKATPSIGGFVAAPKNLYPLYPIDVVNFRKLKKPYTCFEKLT